MEEDKQIETPQQQVQQEEKEQPMEEDQNVQEEIKQNVTSTVKIYSFDNFSIKKREIGTKKEQKTFEEKMNKLRLINQTTHLPKRSVYGVILIHKNNFPYVMIFQKNQSTNMKDEIQLVGGTIKNGEEVTEGLIRKMKKQLNANQKIHYEVGELLGTFYRINYSNNFYPYLPSHVSIAKEVVSLYMIHIISENCNFMITERDTVTSIPLFNLYNNTNDYNDILSSIPLLVSRYCLIKG